MASLWARGELAIGEDFVNESVIGTRFTARVAEQVEAEGRPAWITEVAGAAYRTGEHRFVLDPRDPLGTGFVLR